MSPKFQSGKNYFTVRLGTAAMSAFIPKNTQISLDVLQWNCNDFNEYLNQQGYRQFMPEEKFTEFRRLVRKFPNGFKEDYIILEGKEPVEPTVGALQWLAAEGTLRDLAIANVPFLKVIPPTSPLEGSDVYGRVVLPKVRETPPKIFIDPDPEIFEKDNFYSAIKTGQVRLEGNKLRWYGTYRLEDIGGPAVQKIEWPCSVHVKCDLEPALQWKVNGNLTVDGHWACGNITVFGNVIAKSGLQTNMQGVVRIYGDAQMSFVQMTRLGVAGNLLVGGSILQSEVRVGGSIIVKGPPGAIMGSNVDTFGHIHAVRAGSDQGRKTILRLLDNPDAPHVPSKVQIVAMGTQIQWAGKSLVVKEDMPFHSDM
jgi:hypothetical protein